MKRFRIGNDIAITWEVKKNGQALDLTGKKVSLYITHPKGREALLNNVTTLQGSSVSYLFEGLQQEVLGRYTLTIDVREDVFVGEVTKEKRILIQDKCGAFELVGRSCVEEPEETDYSINL